MTYCCYVLWIKVWIIILPLFQNFFTTPHDVYNNFLSWKLHMNIVKTDLDTVDDRDKDMCRVRLKDKTLVP